MIGSKYVSTFLDDMRRLAFYVFATVIIAFIAGVLDVGQVLIRDRTSSHSDAGVSSVSPLLVARELALAISIGFRFFFFWSFVSQPPRGELPSTRTSQEQGISFRMGSNVHSGSWTRWGIPGVILQYTLLFATITIPVLQLIWRFSEQFDTFGPVYNADGTLEIVISALFVIKLLTNAWISPLTPRWKTIRDYSPVIIALLLGLAVGIGNILCCTSTPSTTRPYPHQHAYHPSSPVLRDLFGPFFAGSRALHPRSVYPYILFLPATTPHEHS